MKLTKIVLSLMMLATAFTSCIREDFDDCYSTNRLLLSYKGDGKTEIFPEKICRVEMFIFNEEDKCVASQPLSPEEVAAQEATLPPLKAGNYRIICLGNTHTTEIDGIDEVDYSQMIFADIDYFDEVRGSGNDSLYYASTYFEVLSYTGHDEEQNRTQTIEFASSHYDLYVEVIGVPGIDNASRADGTLASLEICGVAPCTDFENRVCGEPTDYTLEAKYDPAKLLLTSFTNIMRHTNHEDVNINFYPSPGSAPLATVNLKEFLDANPIIDCTKHEVLIPITIEFKGAEVIVSVSKWYIQNVIPDFE